MLRIVTGNRQEVLLDRLAASLRTPAAANPLIPETLVCERGVDRWLWQQLAERHRIAANLDCVLPATFLWRTLRQVTGTDDPAARDPFEGALVRWRLMRLIPALLAGDGANGPMEDVAPLARYLAGDEDGRKLAQLAERVGALFDAYLVYRPGMIAAWDAGRDVSGHPSVERWQRRLWQALTADSGTRHRVTLMQDFCADDERGRVRLPSGVPRRVSVFGLPALPPSYVDLLARLAKHIDITLYVLSPSHAFWGDLLSPAAMAQVEARTGYAFDIGNRLLAANGQPVRHFLSSLAEQEAGHEEAFITPGTDPSRAPTLLQRIQADILDLTETRDLPVDRIDDSVEITSAYGPMREVEILHDRLLALFSEDATLRPRDVLVMAPDIERYAPLVDAVFGAAEGVRHIPYGIADVPARGSSPLLVALEALLNLPDSRLTVNEVLALLEAPPVAARWQLSPADLDLIRTALREANVRWGLDAASRARDNLPDDPHHTWRFAFERLFMGLAIENEDALVLGVAPCPAFEGQAAGTLGRLQDFVDALARWQQRLSGARAATDWTDSLHALLEAFFLADNDADEAALATIVDALAAFHDDTIAANYTAPITHAVFRDELLARLSATPGRGGFLRGGVTCCRLQPMRSLPHRVICLLGMDADAYPRRQPQGDFDLIALEPIAGDRARRLDDRHLFLETLLSTRERLYISHVGRSARDDTPREPSVLVGELIDTIVAMHGGDGMKAEMKVDGTRTLREVIAGTLIRQHPLQPFSPRYFDGSDPALRSADADWLVAARGRAGADNAIPPFCPEPLPAPEEPETRIPLVALVRFFSHPGRAFLRERLGIDPDEDDDTLDDDEPFTLDGLARWQLGEDWLDARIEGSTDEDWLALQRGRGTLPAGAFGITALAGTREVVDEVQAHLAGKLDALRPQALDIDLGDCLPGDCRLAGALRHVNDEGVLHWSTAGVRGKRLLALWIEHLALCAAGIAARSTLVGKKTLHRMAPVAADEARRLLADLVALRRQGLRQPLRFPVDSALAFTSNGKSPEKQARSAWQGSFRKNGKRIPGEREDAANRILFRHVDDIVDDEFRELATRIFGPLVAGLEQQGEEDDA